jgi:molybdenum transport protein
MIFLTDYEIDYIVSEDLTVFDFTSYVLDIKGNASISFFSRQNGIVCGIDEVIKIFSKFDVTPIHYLENGMSINSGDLLLSGTGNAQNIHKAWKVSLNILEYMSGVATATFDFVAKAKQHNPDISVVTTRKTVPGTKKLALKAIMTGGAIPHRLSLSDSVLIFKEHTEFTDGLEGLSQKMNQIRIKAAEKKIGYEAKSIEEAKKALQIGFDIIQLDKMSCEDIKEVVLFKNLHRFPSKLSAAGGINFENVGDFAATGVDLIVTSSLYFAKPLDIKVSIKKL